MSQDILKAVGEVLCWGCHLKCTRQAWKGLIVYKCQWIVISWIGSAALSQLAFLQKSSLIFPWKILCSAETNSMTAELQVKKKKKKERVNLLEVMWKILLPTGLLQSLWLLTKYHLWSLVVSPLLFIEGVSSLVFSVGIVCDSASPFFSYVTNVIEDINSLTRTC